MEKDSIYVCLCAYDLRNPNNVVDQELGITKPDNCSCDNCFYGRTELAEEIIERYGR